jgi:hypothetical protein
VVNHSSCNHGCQIFLKIPKRGEINQVTAKLENGQNFTNSLKITQIDRKIFNIFHSKAHQKNYLNLDFWSENIQSGNPCSNPFSAIQIQSNSKSYVLCIPNYVLTIHTHGLPTLIQCIYLVFKIIICLHQMLGVTNST